MEYLGGGSALDLMKAGSLEEVSKCSPTCHNYSVFFFSLALKTASCFIIFRASWMFFSFHAGWTFAVS
jgi:hypothetical protein